MAFCANCGSPVEGGFCAKCGAPTGAAAPPPGTPAPATIPAAQSGLSDNVVAALCYSLTIITGILFLVLEPYNRNRNIRFHAFQAIFLGVAAIAIRIALGIVFGILWSMMSGFFFLASFFMLYGLACFCLWIYMILTAYQGKKVVLPIIGPLAEKQA
ncbi:MAG TPA: hypothetical protein VGS58_02610 [Candidatus Sulfopaludibacter sp.]|nr:hypothetical protein [Candidatus Sulfopaludibacter sp.]